MCFSSYIHRPKPKWHISYDMVQIVVAQITLKDMARIMVVLTHYRNLFAGSSDGASNKWIHRLIRWTLRSYIETQLKEILGHRMKDQVFFFKKKGGELVSLGRNGLYSPDDPTGYNMHVLDEWSWSEGIIVQRKIPTVTKMWTSYKSTEVCAANMLVIMEKQLDHRVV